MTESLPKSSDLDPQSAPASAPLSATEPTSHGSFGKAVALGLGVAVIGGGLWAGLSIFGNIELGILAWGIGLAIGTTLITVIKVGSTKLGLAALLLALFALSLGKGLVDQFQTVPAYYAEFEDPAEARDALAALKFRERFGLDGFDLLWAFLALGSAWQLGRGKSGG